MTKKELIQAISSDVEMPLVVVEAVLDGLGRAATQALADGGEVTIPGLVKLKTKDRAARMSRNPRTGEPVEVPAKKVVSAKVAKQLADAVA